MDSEQHARDAGCVRVVFASREPLSLESLRAVLERHADELARLESLHSAVASVRVNGESVVELSFALDGDERLGPAAELEALAAVHDLELELAREGFTLHAVHVAA